MEPNTSELKTGLIRLARKMSKLNIRAVLGELSQQEFFALQVLYCRMQKPGGEKGIYVSELARGLNIAASAVSRMLHTLEERGMVERAVDPGDRRNTYVCLTPKGRELCARSASVMDAFSERVVSRFGEEKSRQLLTLWGELSDIMAEELKPVETPAK